jgi:hypothetical protein
VTAAEAPARSTRLVVRRAARMYGVLTPRRLHIPLHGRGLLDGLGPR